MDFLRRLTPLRSQDSTQAVAVLPSRFAGTVLLAATSGSAERLGHPVENVPTRAQEAAPASDQLRPQDRPLQAALGGRGDGPPGRLAATSTRTAGGSGAHAYDHAGFAQRVALDPALAPPRRVDADATQLRRAKATASAPDHQERRGSAEDRQAGSAAYARSAADAPGFVETGLHGIAAPATRADATAPLSAASVAHRRRQAADDSQVVHVTIGRIDVVAVSPPPAARRTAAPRQGTATLSDYLRDGNGGRR